MPASREPFWWYGQQPLGLPHLLSPFAVVYGAISARRMVRKPAYVAPLPVICVGNFVAGGSGKSPIVRALVSRLRKRGMQPAILSRGYGGALAGPVWVAPETHTFRDVGDEPLMLARDAPVMVARDRAAGARAIVAAGGIDVIVMDDGLQSPGLAKSLSLAIVNRARGLGNARVIPSGPLRAPLSAQLAQVDAIILAGAQQAAPTHAERELTRRIASTPSATRPGRQPPILQANVVAKPIDGLNAGTRVLVFAAIANPERAFESARSLGLAMAATRAFPDHHAFTDDELADLVRAAGTLGAHLVTTEKDMARLLTGSAPARALAQRTSVIRIDVEFDAKDAAAIDSLLDGAIGAHAKAIPPQRPEG